MLTSQKRSTEFNISDGISLSAASILGDTGLKGKVVLVTGANRGLGLGFMKYLTERGAVVIGGCRNPDAADEMNELIASVPGSFSVKMDLQSEESLKAAAATVATKVLGATCTVFHPSFGWLLVDLRLDKLFSHIDRSKTSTSS